MSEIEKFLDKLHELKNSFSDKTILNEIEKVIKKFSKSKSIISPKQQFENSLIEIAKYIFEKYPIIEDIPLIHYGIFHIYECAGEDYCSTFYNDGFQTVNAMAYFSDSDYGKLLDTDNELSWSERNEVCTYQLDYLEEAENYDDKLIEMSNKLTATNNKIYSWYGRPQKGGVLIYINKERLKIEIVESDSGE